MIVKKAGRRRGGDLFRSVNSTQALSVSHQTYSYNSPKITLECEKLSQMELKKLSGEVKIYKLVDKNNDK
ncbi:MULTISPECIES: hypothetical protein [Bacillus cereus group]|uniref:Uncharacterized protein n=1 Tax=Bacillus cereus (strain G9842) TaxID=405531 RepID=B7IZA1_BACC2|nr:MULTISPECIES: hypothetical protein [Bacillus cereus group]ACK98694.1 hypothetical protein BCG9842_0078 [Bacillus cereus G9842]MCU7679265.1 hypothetical protein [Bacillus thuringiensis]MDR4137398.1 hypothetical protein [Bacillus cereus]MDR4368838.1 hypothetical protein [Bacillus cereus]PEE63281.1 hypothetical protein COM74_19410 [Bacillus thuringiensis]